jgi:hypothetical protein
MHFRVPGHDGELCVGVDVQAGGQLAIHGKSSDFWVCGLYAQGAGYLGTVPSGTWSGADRLGSRNLEPRVSG